MKKLKDIEIPPQEPFKNSVAGRDQVGRALTNFLDQTDTPLVMSIDAPWGQGKTTFLHMWREHLKQEGFTTIYYNAWNSDHGDNAMLSLIGELSSAFSGDNTQPDQKGDLSKSQKLLSQVKSAGADVLKHMLPLAAKLATNGVINLNGNAEELLSNGIESLVEQQINSYDDAKNSVTNFRTKLAKFAGSVSDDGKPLIIIIDELDRCRPSYAIEILEKAKHFFNVENVVFVLGVDKRQLGSSFKAVYGEGLNVDGYMRRFFDVDFLLPPPKSEDFIQLLLKRFGLDDLLKKMNLPNHSSYFKESLSALSDIHGLSMRDRVQCVSLLYFSLSTIDHSTMSTPHPMVLCYFIVLKIKNSELYNDFLDDKIEPKALLQHIVKRPGGTELLMTNGGLQLEVFLSIVKISSNRFESIKYHFKEEADKITGTDSESTAKRDVAVNKMKYMENDFVEDFCYSKQWMEVINQIELAARFNR
ncbi:KAP family P-loop NTPase fold protein [Gilvimarinus polysaccharolyticus]|uniref:KAP family P-loop NTPase fold protein n=1 Tax=Gilvimarinus polysaccharolyticus TaxID=863921 RepID=UPI0006739A7C|nr:P-loop NTPase fold protein [Gilvimarinus polysaccharolyticus]